MQWAATDQGLAHTGGAKNDDIHEAKMIVVGHIVMCRMPTL